jgi:ribose/xylose/arabinose/galactoside ABC-type transport system permease subunit
MKRIKWSVLFTDYALFWLIIITTAFFTIMQPVFLGFGNMMNILKNASYMIMMVTGLTWVIAAGEIDCSFPDVASCSSMVFAWFVVNDYTLPFSIFMGLLAGLFCGVLTSFFVVKCGFHSLITTIGVSTIAKSVASAINGGMPLVTPGIKSTAFYRFINSTPAGFSVNFIIVVVIFVLLLLIQEKTKYGQHIYALGENRQAINEAGIKSGRILASVFILSAVFAGIAGIVTVFMVYGCGMPRMGTSFFLDGFTMVFLGATAFKHSKTNMLGTFIGGIMLAMIVNGMTLMGGTFAASQITKGVFLVIGIFISTLGQRKNRLRLGLLKYE